MLFYVNLKILYLLFSFEVKNVYNINTQLNFLIAILFFTRKLKFYGQLIYLSNPTKKKKKLTLSIFPNTLLLNTPEAPVLFQRQPQRTF